jgi:hypothetical protein
MTETRTRTVTRSQAETLVGNSVWDLAVAIADETGADDGFIHRHGGQLDRIVRRALDQRRLDGVALVVVDERDRVVDPWEIRVSDHGSQVTLREPDIGAVVTEIRRYGTRGAAVLVLPLVDGVDEFSLPDPGTKIDTYGGARLEAGLYHGRCGSGER